jgi:PAS domain S-box-containing protein
MSVASSQGSAHDTARTGACPVSGEAMPLRLLLVEDNPSDVLFLQKTLACHGREDYATSVAGTLKEAATLLDKKGFDAALLDLSLPDSQGLATIEKLAAFAPNLPIVVLTGIDDAQIVADVVHYGAQDYLQKGQSDAASIARAIHYAMDRKQVEQQLRAQREELEQKNRELEETQKRLEAYRDRYINLYDFAPLGYLTLDEDGYIQEINLAGAQLLEIDREAITGYPFADYVVKEDVPVFLDMLRNCVGEHSDATCELRLATQGGRSIAAQLRSVPVKISVEGIGGDVTFCKTAITDISQRKEMEETIRQSRAFLQTVIDALPDAMLVIGRDYRIVLANRAARDLSGQDDIVSRCLPCYQVSHRSDAPCSHENHVCPLRKTIENKVPMTVTHTHYDAQGRAVFVEVMAAPVFDESGEVTHIIESCRDITERKRAEEELAQDRNLLRTLIDDLPDCIFVKDAESRFLAANVATARLMGLAAPSDLLGKTDFDFYPPELAAQYRAVEEELLRSGKPEINQDEPRRDANGQWRTVLTTKVPMRNDEGAIVGLVGISRDISERVAR